MLCAIHGCESRLHPCNVFPLFVNQTLKVTAVLPLSPPYEGQDYTPTLFARENQ